MVINYSSKFSFKMQRAIYSCALKMQGSQSQLKLSEQCYYLLVQPLNRKKFHKIILLKKSRQQLNLGFFFNYHKFCYMITPIEMYESRKTHNFKDFQISTFDLIDFYNLPLISTVRLRDLTEQCFIAFAVAFWETQYKAWDMFKTNVEQRYIYI